MSDIQPKGIPVTIADQEWHFYLTIAAADEIQDHYDQPLSQVMNTLLTNERERYGAVAYLAAVLTSDEVRRGKLDKKAHTEKELRDLLDVPEANRLTGIILRAYGISMPERDEDEDPNLTRTSRKRSTSRGSSTSE